MMVNVEQNELPIKLFSIKDKTQSPNIGRMLNKPQTLGKQSMESCIPII